MKFYLSMFCFIILKTNVESVILNINPTTIQAGTPSLTIRCQAQLQPYEYITSLDEMKISRNKDGIYMNIASIINSPELGPGFGSPKYTVTGSIPNVNSAFLQIVIQEPNCDNIGEYSCDVTVSAIHYFFEIIESSAIVTVQANENPSDITICIIPKYSEYNINTTVSMACNGNVGKPRKTWQWQTRRFPATTQWVRLTDGVVDGDVTPPTGASCSYRQQTTLTYVVKSQDDGLQIRCILDNSEEFSENYTINLALTDTSSMLTSPTNSPALTDTSSMLTSPTNSPALTDTSSMSTSPTTSSGLVLIVFGIILVASGVVIALISVYVNNKPKVESEYGQESTYELIQQPTTPNLVYTSLDDNQYLTPTSVNRSGGVRSIERGATL